MADIITLAEYKAFASIEGKKTDTQIAALIASTSQIVNDFLGYDVAATGAASATLLAREGVVRYMIPDANIEISAATISVTDSDGNTELIDPSKYFIHETGLIEFFGMSFVTGHRIVVTYNIEQQALDSIKLATNLLVKYYYKEEFNKTSMGSGGQTVSFQTGKNFPPHVRAILAMYRVL